MTARAPRQRGARQSLRAVVVLLATAALAGCAAEEGGVSVLYEDDPLPGRPDIDLAAAPDPEAVARQMIEIGEYEYALRAYAVAIQRDGLSPSILIGLGAANERLGRLNQARTHLEAAVEQAPESVVAWNNLGVVLDGLGETEKARSAFLRAFALDSGDSETVRTNLARTEHKLGFSQPETAETPAQPQFELVRRGQGRYLLIEAEDLGGGTT